MGDLVSYLQNQYSATIFSYLPKDTIKAQIKFRARHRTFLFIKYINAYSFRIENANDGK